MPNIIHQLKMMTQQEDQSRIRDLLQSLIDKNKAPESPYETQQPMSPDEVVDNSAQPKNTPTATDIYSLGLVNRPAAYSFLDRHFHDLRRSSPNPHPMNLPPNPDFVDFQSDMDKDAEFPVTNYFDPLTTAKWAGMDARRNAARSSSEGSYIHPGRQWTPDDIVRMYQGSRTPYEDPPGRTSMHPHDLSNLYRERSEQRPGGFKKELGYKQRFFPELYAHESMQSVHQPGSEDNWNVEREHPPYYFDMRHADATGYFTPLQETERTGSQAADKERLIDLHSKDKPSWSEKFVDFLVENPTRFIDSIFQNHRIHMAGNTNSMYPAVLGGDIVVYKNRDNEELEIGDFVAFRPSWRDDVNIAHRIVDVTEDGWIMRGDNVARNDPAPVKDEDVFAMFKFRIPLHKIPMVHNAAAAKTERSQRERRINNYNFYWPLDPKRHDPAYWLRKYSAQE